MSKWLSRRLQLDSLGRHATLSERATLLALAARFVDEFSSGAIQVLLPTLRRTAGLSVVQVGLLLQVMDLVGAVADSIAGFAVDLWRRRPLLVGGALGWSVALAATGLVPTFTGLLVAFAAIGAASGMLAHTADVVLIEGHPEAPDRISTVSTIVDTVGALLAPLSIAVLFQTSAAWRWHLLASAAAVAVYALALRRTGFPEPPGRARDVPAAHRRVWSEIAARVRTVLSDGEARRWMAFLLLDGIVDVALAFEPLWLVDVAGFSQAGVGLHVAVELAASMAGLLLLDRLLRRWDAVLVLRWSLVAEVIAWVAWAMVGGPVGQLLLVVPRSLVAAPIWPVARARAISSVPGSAGTVGALLAIPALLPFAAAFGWGASTVGLHVVMLVVPTVAFVGMLTLLGTGRRGPAHRATR